MTTSRWRIPVRWLCARHGHQLICTPDGHTCARCGQFYPLFQRGKS